MTSPLRRSSDTWTTVVLVLFITFMAQPAFADTSVGSIETAFTNASTSWVAFMNLVRGASFLIGIFIGGLGLIKLKDIGDGRTTIKTPIWFFVISAALISMPASIDTITQTMSLGTNTGTQLLSQTSSSIAGVADALTGILLFVKLLGHVAFLRGLLILKDVGAGAQGASMGRGMTHLLGGAAAININATASILAATFFTGMTLPGGIGG